jgi:hypothetical protein
MFVTSDVHNMRAIGLNDRIDWREHLLCGVAVHASSPVGIERLAGFLFDMPATRPWAASAADLSRRRPSNAW